MSAHDSSLPVAHAWKSVAEADIPKTDAVSFAFSQRDTVDQDKKIFIDATNPETFLTSNDVFAAVRGSVKGFYAAGLQVGDCVSLHLFNGLIYPVLFLAILAAGGIVSGVNPGSTVDELLRYFELTKPKFVFVQLASLATVKAAADRHGIPPERLILVDGDGVAWRAFLREGDYLCQDATFIRNHPESIAMYSITSGTTGLPKIAMISHRAIIAQVRALMGGFQDRDYQIKQLSCLPCFHAFAGPLSLILPLVVGFKSYILPRFELQSFITALELYKITDVAVVPTIISELLQQPPMTEYPYSNMRFVKYIICGGAALSPRVQEQLYRWLDVTAVIAQCYGATECGWTTVFHHQERDTSGSVGRLMPNVQLQVVSETGQYLEDGIHSEGLVKSPTLFSGYLGNDQATQQAFTEHGFYRTGDIIRIEHGKVFLEGRTKDIMKVHGWQVSPEEIEQTLKRHPMITDAAVAGITSTGNDGVETTLIHAYVVRSSRFLTPGQIMQFLRSSLSKYKLPTGGIHFVDGIPRSATGKVVRHNLANTTIPES